MAKFPTSILIVPNYAISGTNDGHYRIGGDQGAFMEEICAEFYRVGLSCFVYKPAIKRHDKPLSDPLGNLKVTELGIWKSSHGAITKLRQYCTSVWRLLRRSKEYDFVYLFLPGWCPLIAGIICRLTGRQYGIYARCGLEAAGPVVSIVYSWLVKRAKFCLCTGQYLYDQVRPYSSRVSLVSPMIAFGPPDKSPARVRAPGEPLRILFTGTLRRSKGIVEFLRLTQNLHRRNVPVEAKVAGAEDPSGEINVKNLIDELGIGEVAYSEGYIKDPDQLKDLYCWADVFVYPTSHNEGFPRVVYEAMLFGAAIVSYRRSFYEGFLTHGENCLLAETHNDSELDACLSKLVSSNEFYQRITSQAQKDVIRYLQSAGRHSHAKQVRILTREGATEPSSENAVGL